MEVTITALQGPERSLPAKLDALLLLDGFGCVLLQGEKKRIRCLKRELEHLISEYLVEPADVGYPASLIFCWVKEVAELAYDIDDGVDKLKHEYARGSLIYRLWKKLRKKVSPLQWLADDVSEFRGRLKRAIQRHTDFHLDQWTVNPDLLSDEHHQLLLPPLDSGDYRAGPLGIDSSIEIVSRWLDDNEGHGLKVVAVAGPGGIGKTTLAKGLCRKLGGQFECLAFVRSSQNPDLRMLLTDLLSQIRPHQHVDTYQVPDLKKQIKAHLRYKKYFIVVDDLWTLSTWRIVNSAFPDGNHGSRILVTTDIQSVAQTCCGHNSRYIFNMEPLTDKESSELFFSKAFGHRCDFLRNQSEALCEIIREKCGGLPLATITTASVLANHPDRAEQWIAEYRRNSSNIDWATNLELARMKQVLCVNYNVLPHRLKACMLYLCIYKEEYLIPKDKLVKLWVAEGFVSENEGKDKEEVARSNFDELIRRGLIQPVDVDHDDEVSTCTVHHLVLSLIRYKSMEYNFITVLDHSQMNITLVEKVRRLSIHFSNAEVSEPPSTMELSHVRSLAFFGLSKSMFSVSNFKLLQVIILHLWPDHNKTVYDLTGISELFRLKVLQIMAHHLIVKLPMQMKHLKNLVTLEIEGRLSAVPVDIVNLPRLLHLSLPSEIDLLDRIGHMISLRALRYFNISNTSIKNVEILGELINLQDLHLTCSRVAAHQLKTCLTSVLGKLGNLRSLILNPVSHNTDILERDASNHEISCELENLSSPPALLKKLELSPRICTFFSLPKWIGELHKLCILKIKVMELSSFDVCTLGRLSSLTALSLYVVTAPAGRIIFGKDNFLGLKYFKFMCTTPCMVFLEGTMPNVQRLKLGVNVNRMDQYCLVVEAGFWHLSDLKEISLKIGVTGVDESNKRALESEMVAMTHKHPGSPVIKLKCVEWLFYGDKEKNILAKKDTLLTPEKQAVITGEELDKDGLQNDKMEDTKKGTCSRSLCDRTPHLQGSGSRDTIVMQDEECERSEERPRMDSMENQNLMKTTHRKIQ